MGRTLIIIGAVLLLLLPPAARAASVEVAADGLNVRDGPGGTVLGQVGRGQRFFASASSGGWLRIDWSGRAAWISAAYARAVQADAVEVTASALNVRTGPSTAHAAFALARAGQRYVRLAAAPGWVQVQLDRRAGWVSADFVRDLGSTPTPAPAPTPAPGGGGGGWASVHRGLTLDGVPVPRRGVANTTLRRSLGVAVEPYGEVVSLGGASFVRGTSSWFGGPRDTGVTSTETGALTGERLRSLNTPLSPSAADLAARPGDFYYVAMRFDYAPRGAGWWRSARLLVVNPANGRAVVVRPVDWGPHTRTGRTVDLSPQAMTALGLTTDRPALVAFAAPGTPLGPVR